MKVTKEEILINCGDFYNTDQYRNIHQEILTAISKVVWPTGTDTFTIFPERKSNGVVPIKRAFQNHLRSLGWTLEDRTSLGVARRPGPIDATRIINNKLYAVEWETGNISSSHRALNKMVVGILNEILIGGTLIIPSRNLYKYLTDRIGSFEELEPYFAVWRSIKCSAGLLLVIAIEHDAVSNEVPRIRKGTDGRALR